MFTRGWSFVAFGLKEKAWALVSNYHYIQAKIILPQMRALTVNIVRNPQISDIFESTVNRIF